MQVWGVGFDDMQIYMRSGINQQDNSGKSWKQIKSPYHTYHHRYKSENSDVNSLTSSSRTRSESEVSSPERHLVVTTENTDINKEEMKKVVLSDHDHPCNKAHENKSGSTVNSDIDSSSDIHDVESREVSVIDSKSVHINPATDPASNISVHLENESNYHEQTVLDNDSENHTNNVQISLIEKESIQEKSDEIDYNLISVLKERKLARMSSDDSNVSDSTVDFVWDYEADDTTDNLYQQTPNEEMVRFSQTCSGGKRMSEISVHYQNPSRKKSLSEDDDKSLDESCDTCKLSAENCHDPDCERHRASPAASVLDEMEAFLSDPVSVSSPLIGQAYDDVGDINWLSVSAMSCSVIDDTEVPMWFRSRTGNSCFGL